MERRSLLDGTEGIGASRGGGGGGPGMDRGKIVKLSIAGALFVVAGLLFAWQYTGLFEGRSKYAPPEPTQAEKAARETEMKAQQEKMEQLEREGKITIGGA